MNTKYFSINDSSKWEVIKNVGTVLPRVGIPVFSDYFIIESVNLGDLSGFMITSKKSNVLRISYFQAK